MRTPQSKLLQDDQGNADLATVGNTAVGGNGDL